MKKKIKYLITSVVVSLIFLIPIDAMDGDIKAPDTPTRIQKEIELIDRQINEHEKQIKSLQLAQTDAKKAILQFERIQKQNLTLKAKEAAEIHARHHLAQAKQHDSIFNSEEENIEAIKNYIGNAEQKIKEIGGLIKNAQQNREYFQDELDSYDDPENDPALQHEIFDRGFAKDNNEGMKRIKW